MSALEIELEMEELLLRIVPELKEQWQGASPEMIARIERLADRPLPPFYRWFLSRMGKSMGALAYPTLDFSAQRVLACYAEKLVAPDPRFLLIGHESNEMMPLHVFYDFDVPAREDALVTERDAMGGELYDRFETLREMLAWGAILKFRVNKMPQKCEGILSSDDPDLLSRLEPLMSSLGFTKPISTGSCCGLYERYDVVMICKRSPREELVGIQAFRLGGRDAGVLRKILGRITTESSLEVEVDEWTPALR
ncbi:SMI1/KNR4 family protein [Archangium sp.]|uniref:SMI1/KNR4 family protein n=1 Tax=Archangium sp. TaxID=1872627 RepID=UPI00389984D4